MLDKIYTIPIVLGICLGIIMSGVQVSAGALDAALGAGRHSGMTVSEYAAHYICSFADKLRCLARAGRDSRAYLRMGGKVAESWKERVIAACGPAYAAGIKFYRLVIKTIRAG